MTEEKQFQKKEVLEFLKRVVQRAEKELGMRGVEYSHEDPIEGEDCQAYTIWKESLDPPLILEIDVGQESIIVYDYRDCSTEFYEEFCDILKEELPGLAKKLKIDDWAIAR